MPLFADAQLLTEADLRTGDLLFQDLDCGPLCDAIEKVTPGYRGAEVTHVGLVVVGDDGVTVLEAIGAAVQETPLEKFLGRTRDAAGNSKVFAERLRWRHRHLIPEAVTTARSLIGRPYDDRFIGGIAQLYCSELVLWSWQVANGGEPVLPLLEMTFTDPTTGLIFPPWQAYFDSMGLPVPEGAPGSNPGNLSMSPMLRWIGAFGELDRSGGEG